MARRARADGVVVRPLGGGVDRVTILWADNAIDNQWLQVSVLATAHTGLLDADVFSFGNAIGEAGNAPGNAIVNATDEILARNFPHGVLNRAAVDDLYDYNRDGLVNGTDQIARPQPPDQPAVDAAVDYGPGGRRGVEGSVGPAESAPRRRGIGNRRS